MHFPCHVGGLRTIKGTDGTYLLNSIDVPKSLPYRRAARLEAAEDDIIVEMCKSFHLESGCFSFPILMALAYVLSLVCNPLHNPAGPQFTWL
jgi:hypothetical protein